MKGKADERGLPRQPAATSNGSAEQKPLNEQQELHAKTLKGDIRDRFLNYLQSSHATYWASLTEAEQKSANIDVLSIADRLVRDAIFIVKSDGHNFLSIRVPEYHVKGDEIAFKGSIDHTRMAVDVLEDCRGQRVLLVPIDPDKYMGERKAFESDKIGTLGIPVPTTGPGTPTPPETMEKLGRGKEGPYGVGDPAEIEGV